MTVAQVANNSTPPVTRTDVGVTVTNGGRRPITHLVVNVANGKGKPIGSEKFDALADGSFLPVQFPATEEDEIWGRRGGSAVLDVLVRAEFSDLSGHRWVLLQDGTLAHEFVRRRWKVSPISSVVVSVNGAETVVARVGWWRRPSLSGGTLG